VPRIGVTSFSGGNLSVKRGGRLLPGYARLLHRRRGLGPPDNYEQHEQAAHRQGSTTAGKTTSAAHLPVLAVCRLRRRLRPPHRAFLLWLLLLLRIAAKQENGTWREVMHMEGD